MENLKEECKNTEIGVIPEDWEVVKLGDIAKIQDGTHQTPNYVKEGVPFYSVENITNNDFKNVKYITEEEHVKISKRCISVIFLLSTFLTSFHHHIMSQVG